MQPSPLPSFENPIVYIVDDDPAIRKALKLVVESSDLQAETFESAEAFLDVLPPVLHGCLLLDLRLGGMSGLQLLKTLREKNHHIPTLMISGHGDVPAAVMSMKLGAVEFLEKPVDSQALLTCIRDAIGMSQKQLDESQESDSLKKQFGTLSPREIQILEFIVKGRSTKQIAFETKLSHKTISNHRAHLLAKTASENTADLVRKAIDSGVVKLA